MSEVVAIGAYNATIYGTFAAATAYLQTQYGDAYTAWLALAADDQKRTLAAATRYLDRQVWVADADTFAERDALEAFQLASYELAAMVADLADRLYVLNYGQFLAEGDSETVLNDPRVIEAYIGHAGLS